MLQPDSTLKRRTLTGIFWNLLQRFGSNGISLLITLLLARYLDPGAYGLVGMMAVFLVVAGSLASAGLSQALIRKDRVSPVDLSTAFHANLGLGLISYLLLYLAAPWIAAFYDQPQLTLLVRVAGIVIPIRAVTQVFIAMLSRELAFRTQMSLTLPAELAAGLIALAVAFADGGVWALVTQSLVAAGLVALLYAWRLRWRPGREFSRASMIELLRFGWRLSWAQVLAEVFQNCYALVIARLYDATVAGYYILASRVIQLVIGQLVMSIQSVTYPALAQLQDDPRALRAAYRQLMRVTCFMVFPALSVICALSHTLIEALLPPAWRPAALPLQLLCLSSLLYPLHSINLNLLKVCGRADLFLRLELIKTALGATVLLLTSTHGLTAILLGRLFVSMLSYVPNSHYSLRLIGYSPRMQIGDVAPTLLLSALLGLSVWLADHLLPFDAIYRLLLLGILAPIAYLSSAWLLRLEAMRSIASLYAELRRAPRPPVEPSAEPIP